MRRAKYNIQEIAAAFDAARTVQSGEVRLKDASDALVQNHAFNQSNALIFINVIRRIFEGRSFNMPISVEAMAYCIDRISREDRAAGRDRALDAYLGFIEYDEAHRVIPLGQPAAVTAHRALYASLRAEVVPAAIYPDDVEEDGALTEGAVRSVLVNQYERSPAARRKAIDHYGCRCAVCEFDFENRYGAIGRGFIHVHHVVDIATIGREYQIDPIGDLRPVCPNCHAMLHTRRPAMSIGELKSLLNPE